MLSNMKRLYYVFASLLILILAAGGPADLMGQSKFSLDPGGAFVSRYVWRGTDFGNSPAIQPAVELGYSGFALGAWGSYSTTDANFQEADFYLSYTLKDMFTFMVTDYFFPNGRATDNDYLHYNSDSTGHVFEGSISFNGTEKIPFRVLVATNFAGADAHDADGNLQYSTYIEVGYFTTVGKNSLDIFLAGTPTNPDKDKGESGYYGPEAGIVNLGITASRDIKITESFSLPVSVSVIANPQHENIWFVFGISI